MRRWEYFYISTCINCSNLSLALVSMDLIPFLLIMGASKVHHQIVYGHYMLLKRKIPHDLNIIFLLYLLICWFIWLRKSELFLHCRGFWAVHITSEYQELRLYNEETVVRALALFSPNLWALSLIWVCPTACMPEANCIAGQATLNQLLMTLAFLRAADHATSQSFMLCTAYRQENWDLAVHTWYLCNSKGRGHWEKRDSAKCHPLSCFTTPAGAIRVTEETSLRFQQ